MATSYTDPIYQDLTSKVEAQLGLPSGLLSDIVTKGERSNADQVSEKGAKTVFQVIPKTRDAMLEKYGVDAYVSPENAALVAGYVLRDGINYAKKQTDDPNQIRRIAAGYYHAGGKTENWGPRTQDYMDRVQPVESTYASAKRERGVEQDPITAQVKAYSSGKMSPEDKAAFEQSIARGEVVVPANMMPKTPAASGVTVGAKTLQAYRSGSMRPEDRAEFESLVKSGELVLPNGVSLEAARGEIPSAPTPEQIAAGAMMPTAPAATRATAPNATLGDKALAVGETGLAMVGGLGSLLAGAAGGIQGAIEAPFVGDARQPIRRAQEAAGFVQSLTAPRTAAGQEMLQSVAESPLMQNLQALGPMGMVPTAGTRAVAQSAQTARQMAPAIAQEVTQAVKPAVAQAVQAGRAVTDPLAKAAQSAKSRASQALGMTYEPPVQTTAGTGASAGSAGTDIATLRRERAASLDVPVDLTEGQATREFGQEQFEREMAKDAELGVPIRERMDEQNSRLQQNLDVWLEQTGAQYPGNAPEAGRSIVGALENSARRAKAEIRLKYAKAEKAGETEAPVSLDALIDHINQNGPEAAVSPILKVARDKAIQVGAATVDEAGNLVATQTPLKNAEILRKAIGQSTDYQPQNVRQSSIMKGLIDDSTAGAGGDLYKEARAARARFAQNYEDIGLIDAAMSLKKGSSDRRIAFENVFDKFVLKSSREELSQIRRVIQTQGGEAGTQAWNELRGSTIQYIKDQAFKNTAMNSKGEVVLSPAALEKAIKTLDQNGKLQLIFGRQGATKLRDLADIAKDVMTAPPGSVNTSNTASIVRAFFDAGATGLLTGVPIPAIATGKAVLSKIKNRQLRARIEYALRKPAK